MALSRVLAGGELNRLGSVQRAASMGPKSFLARHAGIILLAPGPTNPEHSRNELRRVSRIPVSRHMIDLQWL